ncbi:UNVERIFIED_ORG: peptidoglycan hydrolase-like protein with peptidoglycan-binding domain [Rhizobium sp. SORGH_AS260]|jgi:peptidoglycan hydrolase-like protein with peptidoglycan-binding domain|uniref:peptidoglycan-binding domain-containing protein n=1 Tax=Agrobacterium TaxID=357 RepID=UPI0015720BAA|nr:MULTISPECIES: peptidoglycan-binding protein [Agrobacterium]MDP9732665.1 peptidoglycan hydrolase-like protein with peptidoglycan-binding domain [Rhizobium sp. SORGH_AS_0285]MDP9755507.1 peptidoglycan hydrolase-like protein with peptidoglycan-binding domain [Rhizobium sp. SORGH_AS_0260]MDR6081836.1 peptidoglycan hydrolase-like protein with peptidoglycan-binding domain [Agrobacterium sp. SORGH_AS_0440]NTE45912.1 peptidoglycan-binding protein [Agrobacterium pusense]
MAPRKRKSPKKTTAQIGAGIVSLVVSAIGREILRHPKLVGGCGAFAVVFGFVAANALWYQPGVHPSPFLRTRDAENPNGIAGYRPAEPLGTHGNVTTFRIERPAETETAQQQPAAETSAQPVAESQKPQQIVADIQGELKKRGLYEGEADGRMGPKTAAAIMFFEETLGMEQTGEPTSRVLAALRIDGATVAAIPKDRPADSSGGVEIDPVAAAIRKAEAPHPKAEPVSLNSAAKPASRDLIAKIQQGLINIAYADVKVDGVAGQQTRNAIRAFEKHYRLPETGEPSEAVLKKLKSIGAL